MVHRFDFFYTQESTQKKSSSKIAKYTHPCISTWHKIPILITSINFPLRSSLPTMDWGFFGVSPGVGPWAGTGRCPGHGFTWDIYGSHSEGKRGLFTRFVPHKAVVEPNGSCKNPTSQEDNTSVSEQLFWWHHMASFHFTGHVKFAGQVEIETSWIWGRIWSHQLWPP